VVNINEEKGNMRRKPMVTCILICTLVLVSVGSLWAETKKRVDLTGQAVTPEDIINALRSPPLTREIEPSLPTALVKIQFAFNSATILPESTQVLNAVGTALQSPYLANDRIRLEGHTDNVGKDTVNIRLSARRAQSVKEYLTNHFGIAPQRLTSEGRGKSEPIETNETPEGRQKNRRVEIVKLPQQ
jgi:outer membrane protein OmpA-like peptidoglycan-associated protein